MTIKFDVAPAEDDLITAIVDRAVAGGNCDCPISTRMDLCALQNSSTPMDLRRLLDADDFNFAHDLFGIARHLDRRDASPTGGELLDCFLPRFAMKAQIASANDPRWLRRRIAQIGQERRHG